MLKRFQCPRNQKPTHVLMNGGTLHVCTDRLNEFNDLYVQSIRAGEKLFVVEQKTPCYKFFIDVDYVDEEALTIENVENISRIICDKVSSLVKGTDDTCVISVSKPKPKGELTKTGIHLNWPNIVTDRENALNIRGHVIIHLNRIYSAKEWNKFIDQAVYGNPETGSNGSGFRLPWSHKKVRDVIEGPYVPIFRYSGGVTTEIPVKHISRELLEDVTVRTDAPTPNVKIEPYQVFTLTPKTHESRPRGKEIDDASSISPLIETFIRRNMQGQSDARVQKVLKDRSTYVIQTNSKYCENIGRSHSSNHVWFRISDKGRIFQRCYCTCETTRGRKKGFCKDFSGREHILTPDIQNVLFPEKVKNMLAVKKMMRTS